MIAPEVIREHLDDYAAVRDEILDYPKTRILSTERAHSLALTVLDLHGRHECQRMHTEGHKR